ncbi:MAG: serine/threonine-protein kinase [Planctomycetaceae bacterium]
MRSGDLTEKPESPADPSEQFLTLMLEIDTALHESRIPQLHDSALRLLSPEERHKLSEACRHLEFLYADSPRSVRHSVPLTINHDQDQARHAGADCDVSLETKSLLSEFGSQFGRFDVLRGLGMGGHGRCVPRARSGAGPAGCPQSPAAGHPGRSVDAAEISGGGGVTSLQLMHPNIVTVFESGVAGAVCYLAQDYVPGPSLDAWLRQHGDPVAPRVAARTVLQLADAVALAHSQRILHRDIKPANILLPPLNRDCDENQLSTFVPEAHRLRHCQTLESDGYTITGDLVGTPAYMSPEQASGRSGHVDFRSDIYSLGTVLYELLTHQPVYRGDNSLEILREVQSGHIVRPKSLVADIPDDLEEVCLKCVRLDLRSGIRRRRNWRMTCGGSSTTSLSSAATGHRADLAMAEAASGKVWTDCRDCRFAGLAITALGTDRHEHQPGCCRVAAECSDDCRRKVSGSSRRAMPRQHGSANAVPGDVRDGAEQPR